MKIRNKILIYFSTTVLALTAISFVIIYLLFAEFREEEFQQRQNDKMIHTIELLGMYKEMTENLTVIMDKLTIHDFYDEKMLVFDKDKDLVFSSADDLRITGYIRILNNLSPANRWIETKEGKYDIVGIYHDGENSSFYAISKAYDAFGYTKLYYLRNVLIIFFFVILLIVVFVSFYLSTIITRPVTEMAEQLNSFEISDQKSEGLNIQTSTDELNYLIERFNQLLKRSQAAFAFQKHAINHISHELKTPIAVIISELEKCKSLSDPAEIKMVIDSQINRANVLAQIINALLELSKIEAGQNTEISRFRVDEIIFDIIDELKTIYPHFSFDINYEPDDIVENNLIINGSKMLIKQAFINLLSNSIIYNTASNTEITLNCSSDKVLIVKISNYGHTISSEEQLFLFNHFFRGGNTMGKKGFGLGLVLAKRIFELNSATIRYVSPADGLNIFEVSFSLS